MTYEEARTASRAGKVVRRASMAPTQFIKRFGSSACFWNGAGLSNYKPTRNDKAATDWEIVQK